MSDAQTQIYLDLQPEIQQLLNENGLSVDEILRQQNIQAKVKYGVVPDAPETDARSKDPVLIILASAGLVLAVSSAISQVLHTLQRKPQLVEYYELAEIRDINGNIQLDKKGKPQLKRVKKYELLEPRKEDHNQSLEASFNPANGLVIKFGATEKQLGHSDQSK